MKYSNRAFNTKGKTQLFKGNILGPFNKSMPFRIITVIHKKCDTLMGICLFGGCLLSHCGVIINISITAYVPLVSSISLWAILLLPQSAWD